MKYRVAANFTEGSLPDFYRQLTDGSIESQRPDGREIAASMKRARMTEPGKIEWYETCYCPTPLKHERETVYDRFLTNITTSQVDRVREIDAGTSFWSYLAEAAARKRRSEEAV